MTNLDFNLLTALDALLGTNSVTAAAEHTGLSTSAMSRTLARLRQVTGDPLLVRAGRDMVPTPHAQAIRDRVHDAVLEARSLLQITPSAFDPTHLNRTFSIRANEGFVEAFGPSLIGEISRQAPGICLQFTPKVEKDPRHLREGVTDLEIGVMANMGPEIRVQALFRDRFVAVVRTGHPVLARLPVTARDYVAHGHVVASRHGRALGPVDEALDGLGLKRTVVSIVPGFSTSLAVAVGSDLIALLPASYLIGYPAGRGSTRPFQTFDLPFPTKVITVSQMWHPRLAADPAHRWLRQQVRRVCLDRKVEGLEA